MRRHVVCGILTVLAAYVSTATAQAKPKVAVLGIEPQDEGTPEAQEQTAERARWLTEALRARASASRSKYDIAPNSQKELTEVKLLSDCLDEAKECMATIGKDLGADRLLYGQLERRAAAFAITLKFLNVATRTYERTTTQVLAAKNATQEGITNLATEIFADLAGMPREGSIVLSVAVEGASVYVNSEPRATVRRGTARLDGLPAGLVDLSITADGYKAWESRLEVKAGQVHETTVVMEREQSALPAVARKSPAGHSGGTHRTLFWTSSVMTAGSVLAFVVTGLQVKQLEFDKSRAIEASWQEADGGIRTTGDACAEAAQMGNAQVTEICNDGKRMALMTNLFIGVASVSALASAYFYYKGYMQPTSPAQDRATHQRRPPKALVSPQLFPSGAGIGATIQF